MAVSLSSSLCFLTPQNPTPTNSDAKPASDQLSIPSSAAAADLRLISSLQATFNLLKPIEIDRHNRSLQSVAFPSLAFSNVLFFGSSICNVEIMAGEDEPEERLIDRFRREVTRAGIIRECRYRKFFESNQEKRKRKSRNAAIRYRKWRPRPKVSQSEREEMPEAQKDEGYDSDEDNWALSDTKLP